MVLPNKLKMNANVYLEPLADHLPESFDMCSAKILQQDDAPAHPAKSVTQWLRDCEVPFIDDWPGNSPDINPIKNLRAIIKKDFSRKDVSLVLWIEVAIWECWENIEADSLRNLDLSLPN